MIRTKQDSRGKPGCAVLTARASPSTANGCFVDRSAFLSCRRSVAGGAGAGARAGGAAAGGARRPAAVVAGAAPALAALHRPAAAAPAVATVAVVVAPAAGSSAAWVQGQPQSRARAGQAATRYMRATGEEESMLACRAPHSCHRRSRHRHRRRRPSRPCSPHTPPQSRGR